MSDWDIKGAQRIREIFGELGSLTKLKQGFVEAGGKEGGKVDSCLQTQRVLGLTLAKHTNNGFTPVTFTPKIKQPERVTMIGKLFSKARAVFVDVSPDHHFVVMSVSPTQVVVMQSYEASYNVLEWSRSAAAGYRKLSTFMTDLKELVSANKATNAEAAVRLFGFGGHIPTVRNIYLNANGPSIILTASYMDL